MIGRYLLLPQYRMMRVLRKMRSQSESSTRRRLVYLNASARGRCELFMPKIASLQPPGRSRPPDVVDGDPIERYKISDKPNQASTTSWGLVWNPTRLPEAGVGPSEVQTHGHLAGGASGERDVAALTDNPTGASTLRWSQTRPSHLRDGAARAAALNWALDLSCGLGSSWRSAESAKQLDLEANVSCCLSVRVSKSKGQHRR